MRRRTAAVENENSMDMTKPRMVPFIDRDLAPDGQREPAHLEHALPPAQIGLDLLLVAEHASRQALGGMGPRMACQRDHLLAQPLVARVHLGLALFEQPHKAVLLVGHEREPQAGAALPAHPRGKSLMFEKGVEGLHVSADRAIGAAEPSSVIGGRPVIMASSSALKSAPCLLFIAPPHTHPGNASTSPLASVDPPATVAGDDTVARWQQLHEISGDTKDEGRIRGKIPYETTRYRDGARRRRGKLRGSLWRQRSSPPRAQLGERKQRRKRRTRPWSFSLSPRSAPRVTARR